MNSPCVSRAVYFHSSCMHNKGNLQVFTPKHCIHEGIFLPQRCDCYAIRKGHGRLNSYAISLQDRSGVIKLQSACNSIASSRRRYGFVYYIHSETNAAVVVRMCVVEKDNIPHDVIRRTKVRDIKYIMKTKCRWAGHIARMQHVHTQNN